MTFDEQKEAVELLTKMLRFGRSFTVPASNMNVSIGPVPWIGDLRLFAITEEWAFDVRVFLDRIGAKVPDP